jgi:dihydroorotate dehydrogenase (fumarate)
MYEALEADMSPHAMAYLNADLPMQLGPERYLARVREIRKEVQVPLIASVNCIHPAQWVSFARKIQSTGVEAIELNVYDMPDDPFEPGSAIEDRHARLVESVLKEVTIPVAVKISPYYSSPLQFAKRLDKLGVAGLVLFNRFFQPDIDIETLALRNTPNLSRPESERLPMRWVAILRHVIGCSLALTGGVHTADGAVRAILAGADVACVASAVMLRGCTKPIVEILDGLRAWMATHGYDDIAKCRGLLAEKDLRDKRGFERAHYVRLLSEQHAKADA